MKAFFLFGLALASSAFASPEPSFRFSYVPNEGMPSAGCAHERIRDLPDWRVTCDFLGTKKEFTAHVIVREHQRVDKTGAWEILYWVTEPGKTPTFHTTSALLGFKGQAKMGDLSIGQGVENDYASLVLDAAIE